MLGGGDVAAGEQIVEFFDAVSKLIEAVGADAQGDEARSEFDVERVGGELAVVACIGFEAKLHIRCIGTFAGDEEGIAGFVAVFLQLDLVSLIRFQLNLEGRLAHRATIDRDICAGRGGGDLHGLNRAATGCKQGEAKAGDKQTTKHLSLVAGF